MNKVAHYLQDHLVGEVLTSVDARKYFSTDASIFTVVPSVIAYPRNESDVRKVARFTWQLAERGRVIPITARGLGTDQSGAAIGEGILLTFPTYMNKIIELDGKNGRVVVEPGLNFGRLQQTLYTHGRFLPSYPASLDYSTTGGAIANNAAGEKTIKYGSTRDFVQGLRVVLANGEIIETRRLSKRELSKKMGLASFEGEIYRSLDKLIEENQSVIADINLDVTKNAAGYDIVDVKQKNGSFDLTPLIVGSQGTLGIVTEATLTTEPYNPNTILVTAFINDIAAAQSVITELRKLPEPPSALEMVDEAVLQFVDQHNPNQLKGLVDKPFHKIILFIEFDNFNERNRKKLANRVVKLLQKHNLEYQVETEELGQDKLWKIRRSVSTVLSSTESQARALPIIEDSVVPLNRFAEYLEGVNDLLKRRGVKAPIWGHAGDGNLRIQPLLDLSHVGDRQKAFKLMDEYYKLIIELGGSISGAHGDGRLRAPYVSQLYGEDVYTLFQKIKKIFDPYSTLNPGVKIDVTKEDIKPLVRQSYNLGHLYDYLPRS